MSTPFQIVWLKRDLRLQDHEPLEKALDEINEFGPVLLLYCHEPEMLNREDFSAQHFWFTQECLTEMRKDLAEVGACLEIRAGHPLDIFKALNGDEQVHISRILAYKESTGPQGFERDKKVRRWAYANKIQMQELDQNGVKRGSHFKDKGFSFEGYATWALVSPQAPWPHPLLARLPASKIWQPWPLPESAFLADPAALCKLCKGQDKPGRQKGGRAAAQALRDEFFKDKRLTIYPSSISSPLTAIEGCSRLSPYLTYGVVSQRELIQEVQKFTHLRKIDITKNEEIRGPAEGVRFFLERMYWRSSYLQRFELYPEMETTIEHPSLRGLREDEFNEELFEAWKAGATGFPFVDASMRMLKETGWINMRMRGMLLSFAANELWLHWREPGLFLAREFLDYEPAIHWHQMQIHSGTCTGSVLTYNPIKQAMDQDPHGDFVRQWVPELSGLQVPALFEPWAAPSAELRANGVVLGQTYPKPVVPATAALDAARKCVNAAREGLPQPILGYVKQRREAIRQLRQGGLF